MRARRSSKFSKIRSPTAELAILERLKNPIDLIREKRCYHFFSAVLDRIHFILAGNDDIHESLDKFEIWPDLTTGFHGNIYGYNEKTVLPLFLGCFYLILFILAVISCMTLIARTSQSHCDVNVTTSVAMLHSFLLFSFIIKHVKHKAFESLHWRRG